jgi:hypothetical protein
MDYNSYANTEYVCMHACMCTGFAHVYMGVCAHTCMHACMNTSIISQHKTQRTRVYEHMHVFPLPFHIYKNTHLYIYIYIYIRARAQCQWPTRGIEQDIVSTLFAEMMSEPCFDQLRTKEQVGVNHICMYMHLYTLACMQIYIYTHDLREHCSDQPRTKEQVDMGHAYTYIHTRIYIPMRV